MPEGSLKHDAAKGREGDDDLPLLQDNSPDLLSLTPTPWVRHFLTVAVVLSLVLIVVDVLSHFAKYFSAP